MEETLRDALHFGLIMRKATGILLSIELRLRLKSF